MSEKIQVKDYELIQNIHILFEKPIMILGAGHLGKKICGLLQEIPRTVHYIYDKSLKQNECMGVPVISLEEVKQATQKEDYLIIIGTENYREELLRELEENEIQGYVCTWYGVQVAIELNINDAIFEEEFRINISERRKVAKSAQNLYTYFTWLKKIYEYPQAILVWQQRKVESMTICQTLDKQGITNIHVHSFMNVKKTTEKFSVENIKVVYEDTIKKYLNRKNICLKIITLEREPVGRALSDFMQKKKKRYFGKMEEQYRILINELL